MKNAAALLMVVLASFATISAQTAPASALSPNAAATAEYNAMVDQYFDDYFRFHPSEGTAAGFHRFDNLLEDFSQ